MDNLDKQEILQKLHSSTDITLLLRNEVAKLPLPLAQHEEIKHFLEKQLLHLRRVIHLLEK